ncbi:unnamed protein product [Lathyrus sativus]|nr:unnamed protein product [Lathyrus sativus]
MNNCDGILIDDWDDDILNQLIKAESAISSKSKTLSTNPSSFPFSNHHLQPQPQPHQQQQQLQLPQVSERSVNFSPPRELSQKPTTSFFESFPPKLHFDDMDIEIDQLKQKQREPGDPSKQIANTEKECLKLKKEKGKKELHPKLVSTENEEDNVRTKCLKSIDKDIEIRAPDHPKASSKVHNGRSSNGQTVEITAKAKGVKTTIASPQEAQDPPSDALSSFQEAKRVETTGKPKGVETKIVSRQEAQDPPSDDLFSYLDLSQKLLTVWRSPSEKLLGSDVISKLFASCQKDIHILFGNMSMSPPEITRKLHTDVSSSKVSLHYVNGCFHTPETSKVSHLYHALTKVANGTDMLETLIAPLLDLCNIENVAIVHSSLRILYTLLKFLLESEKNFGRRDNVFIDGICVGKDLLDSDGLDGVKDRKPFNEEMLSRKDYWNYQSVLKPRVNWSSIFDILHQISTRITEENVRVEAVSIMILLFLRSTAYFEREQFNQDTVFKTISELLKKDAGLRVKKKTLRLLYLVLNCPKLLATFCCGCKKEDSSSDVDDNASVSNFQIFNTILRGLADCVASHGGGLVELKISREAIIVLAFLASSGQSGFEIFIAHRLSTKGVNYLMSILQLLVSEIDREAGSHNELPEIFRERTFLMREILILLNRLVSSPSYSATVLRGLTDTRDMASLTVDVTTRLSRKGNESEQQEDSMVNQVRRNEIVDLARLFKKRVFT